MGYEVDILKWVRGAAPRLRYLFPIKHAMARSGFRRSKACASLINGYLPSQIRRGIRLGWKSHSCHSCAGRSLLGCEVGILQWVCGVQRRDCVICFRFRTQYIGLSQTLKGMRFAYKWVAAFAGTTWY